MWQLLGGGSVERKRSNHQYSAVQRTVRSSIPGLLSTTNISVKVLCLTSVLLTGSVQCSAVHSLIEIRTSFNKLITLEFNESLQDSQNSEQTNRNLSNY